MTFLYPSVLWLLSLIILPILIHLFSFKRKKTIYFSSLTFLKVVEHQNKSTKNFRNILLLLIRIFIFIFLVLAFAQPIKKNEFHADIKSTSIYVDNSFSMSKVGPEGELLSQAKEKAKQLISQAKQGSKFKILTNENNSNKILILSQSEAIESIDKIEYYSIPLPLSNIINSYKKNSLTNEQLFVFSDFQKNTTDLKKIKPDTSLLFTTIKLSPSDNNNIYIDSSWFSTPLHVKGKNSELNIRIQNTNAQDLKNIELTIELKNVKRKLFIDLPSSKQKIVSFKYVETASDFNKGTITINDINCSFDNSYFFSYKIMEKVPILIINGQNQSENIKKVYELDDFYTYKEIDQRSFNESHLSGNQLIVLNGVTEVSSAFSSNINNSLQKGKSVIILPGVVKETQLQSWNNFMNSLNLPIFTGVTETGNLIESINFEADFFKPIFEKDPKKLNLNAIKTSYSYNKRSNYIPLITLQNKSSLYLKNFNRNVYLFTSSLDKEYSNFSSNALFSSILLRTAELSINENANSYIIGNNTLLKLNKNTKSEQPIHIENKSSDFIPQFQLKNNLIYITLNGSDLLNSLKAGNYTINQNKENINELAINYNRKESISTYLSDDQLNIELKRLNKKNSNVLNINNSLSPLKIELKKHTEYWKQFLLFALTLVLIEMVFIRFWKHKIIKPQS